MYKYFVIIFFLNQLVYSQSELDLITYDSNKVYTQRFLDSLGYDYASGELKGRVSANAFKRIIKNNPNLKGWIHYYARMSSILYKEQKTDSSLYFANKGIDYYKELKIKRDIDEHLLIVCYRNKAKALEIHKKFEDAIINYQYAIDLSKKYPFKWISYVTSGVAAVHLSIGNDSIALSNYMEITKDSLYMSRKGSAIITLTRIGVIHGHKKDDKKAIAYYKKALALAKKHDIKNNLFGIYGNLGVSYLNEGIQDSTLYYFKKAIEIGIGEANYDNAVNYNSFYKGYVALYKGSSQEAIPLLEKIIDKYKNEASKDKDDRDLITMVYRTLVSVYQKEGENQKANKMFSEASVFMEEFYEDLLNVQVNKLEIQHQSKQKDASILQLEETTKIQEVILKQRNTINWVLGGFILAIIGLGLLFYKQRQQKNKYNAVMLEQRLLRSQLNPHFLFNALHTVNGLVQRNSEQTIPYISKLGTLLRSILDNSREEFISLKEELETITSYLELQSNFSNKFLYELNVDDSIDVEEVLIPPMFIQPFIENTIAHGFQGLNNEKIIINIISNPKDTSIHCEIIDNGIGYSKALQTKEDKNKHKSLSGTILKERLALYAKTLKIKASYEISDIPKGSGTRVDLYLPYQLDA